MIDRALQKEKWFRILFDLAPEGIFIADIDGEYTAVNQAGCALLGMSERDIVGKTIFDLIPKEESQRLLDDKKNMQKQGSAVTSEWKLRRGDGKYVPVEVSASILEDGRWIGFVRDISEHKELEQLRQQWIAIVAHDLRQPVQEILSASESIQHSNRESLSNLQSIGSSVRKLGRLTEDLFDAAQMASTQFTIKHKKIDLQELTKDTGRRATLAYSRTISTNIHGQGSFVFFGDQERLEQVLDNLLSNAVKYSTPESEITLSLDKEKDRFLFSVSNYGEGLTPEEMGRVFSRFYRAPRPEKVAKGTGLGLYIAKGFVEAHGGTIWVESIPGKKTAFLFTLPAETSHTHT
jgi:PAS domain S-box-containing protein